MRHYVLKSPPQRLSLIPEVKNVKEEPLVQSDKNFPPSLHIKLSLMNNFVKAMNKDGGHPCSWF